MIGFYVNLSVRLFSKHWFIYTFSFLYIGLLDIFLNIVFLNSKYLSGLETCFFHLNCLSLHLEDLLMSQRFSLL